jgi:glutamine synthetase
MAAERTLFGCPPPKGQEFDDHYFGAIPERVLACMFEVERELFRLGIPVKTRHNEVAPGQYEVAPVFEFANVATDHQQLIMVTLQRVAHKYGMIALMHEKPYAGVNGSGKHLNYSMGSSQAGNLFDPGDTPAENAQFLVFCSAMIRAVHKWAPLLRAAVASASNDHRLGANEAPPAILSIFLGDELTQTMKAIAEGTPITAKKDLLHVGVDVIPPVPKHSGDRNRTSPMAFTGNRFEFRAVGSSQSIAGPLVVLNTIMAESLEYCANMLENADTRSPEKLGKAVEQIVKDVWGECEKVVFNGDGYARAWHKEAEQERGLPNLRTTADALPTLKEKPVEQLFERYAVLTPRELASRYEVYAEQYVGRINVESNLVVKMVRTMIFPAAIRYQRELATSLANLKSVGIEPDHKTITRVTELIKSLQDAVAQLVELKERENRFDDMQAHCVFCRDEVLPKMLEIRGYVDELEGLVAEDQWPLPTYQEMLFIK